MGFKREEKGGAEGQRSTGFFFNFKGFCPAGRYIQRDGIPTQKGPGASQPAQPGAAATGNEGSLKRHSEAPESCSLKTSWPQTHHFGRISIRFPGCSLWSPAAEPSRRCRRWRFSPCTPTRGNRNSREPRLGGTSQSTPSHPLSTAGTPISAIRARSTLPSRGHPGDGMGWEGGREGIVSRE